MAIIPPRSRMIGSNYKAIIYNKRMDEAAPIYDPRYLGGIVCFNDHEFFDAHEVWENVWLDCAGPERRFYQGLIQAAVALYHYGNGNVRGATKLYRTSKAYMEQYPTPYLGLDITAFWHEMATCCAAILTEPLPNPAPALDTGLIPTIRLDPAPEVWPDPSPFLREEG